MKRLHMITVTLISISFLLMSLKLNEEIKFLWKSSIGNTLFFPSPVFGEDMIFMGNDDGLLMDFDNRKGKEIWHFQADGGIYQSPLLVDGILYSSSKNGKFYAINANNGKEKWVFETDEKMNCNPILYNSTVIIYTKNNFIALDKETGLDLWKKDLRINGQPKLILIDDQFYYHDNENIYACSASNADLIWTYKLETFGITELVPYGNQLIFLNSNHLYNLNIDGKLNWEKKIEFDEATKYNNKPFVENDIIYCSVGNYVFAYDSKGEELWKHKTKSTTELSNPVAVSGAIFVTDRNTDVIAIDIERGKKKISYQHNCKILSPIISQNQGIIYFIDAEQNLCAVR